MTAPTRAESRRYLQRWNQLRRNSGLGDFSTADLAREIRQHFPAGGSGDHQFRSYICEAFRIGVSASNKLINMVKALAIFKSNETWAEVGGWQSIAFLASLTTRERSRVIASIREDNRRRGLTSSTYGRARELAFRLGIRSRSRYGRPTQTNMERRLAIVGEHIVTLYETFDLGSIPREVYDALLARTARGLSVAEEDDERAV